MTMYRYVPKRTSNVCTVYEFARYVRCVRIRVSCISVYTVLINSNANINSRQLIGNSRDADDYDVVTLIFVLKGPSAGDEGIATVGPRPIKKKITLFISRGPMGEAPGGPTYGGGQTPCKPARAARGCQPNAYLIQMRILTRNSIPCRILNIVPPQHARFERRYRRFGG